MKNIHLIVQIGNKKLKLSNKKKNKNPTCPPNVLQLLYCQCYYHYSVSSQDFLYIGFVKSHHKKIEKYIVP